jgi:nicotinamide mononucleotide transporter
VDYLLQNWLEVIGLISGLACVWLLIVQNVLTFPIGLIYAVVTVIVVARNALYADVLLNLYYVVMNAYGWYFWIRGGGSRRVAVDQKIDQQGEQDSELPVTWVPRSNWLWLTVVTIAGTALMGWYFATFTAADLPYPDSFTTVASFVAMWMSARKYLESWVLWFVIDVVQVALYIYKGIEAYALLYFVYLGMAVWGWLSWRRTLAQPATSA